MASESGVLEDPPRSAWRVPEYWSGGVRRRGDVSPVCGSCTEREKASVDTATGVVGSQGRERERAEADSEGVEYQLRRWPADRRPPRGRRGAPRRRLIR